MNHGCNAINVKNGSINYAGYLIREIINMIVAISAQIVYCKVIVGSRNYKILLNSKYLNNILAV